MVLGFWFPGGCGGCVGSGGLGSVGGIVFGATVPFCIYSRRSAVLEWKMDMPPWWEWMRLGSVHLVSREALSCFDHCIRT